MKFKQYAKAAARAEKEKEEKIEGERILQEQLSNAIEIKEDDIAIHTKPKAIKMSVGDCLDNYKSNIGKRVELNGWVHRVENRGHGN